MTFLTMQQELADRLRSYDSTIQSDLTKIKRWLNMGVQYICGKYLWPFMLAEEIVQTVTDITTGTVSMAAGGITITFTNAPSISVQDRYIQFPDTSTDWYKITDHTASSLTATISPPFVGTSTYNNGTYTIRKLLYSTTTPLIQILDMKQLVTPVRLVSQSPRSTDFFMPLYYDPGATYYYIMSTPNSSGTQQFSLLPSPDTVFNLMVRGVKNLTDMSSDTDVPIIPIPWHDAIINVASYYGFQSLDDTRAEAELVIAEKRIADMKNNYVLDPGRHRIMASVDNDSQYGLQWAEPSQFGPWVP